MVGIPARNETFPGVSDIADTARGCTGTGIEVCVRSDARSRNGAIRLGALPAAFDEIGGEAMKTRPLLQFIADWNNFPDRRDSMLSGSLPEDCDENYAAAIAAVVHGLCSRDDYLMPAGLANRKASEDILISLDTADSEYGKRIRSEAVDVCWQHRVFFTADTLDKR